MTLFTVLIGAALGTFTVSSSAGKWQFITPEGQHWTSLATCCTNPGTKASEYDPKNPSYVGVPKGSTEAEWVRNTQASLSAWGLNSTGGWSADDLFRKYAGKSRLPYFVVLHLGSYNRAPWDDMFERSFEEVVTKAAKELIPQYAEDPKLVGYFSDNELGWWDDALFLHYLAMPPNSAGKQKLVNLARRHYKADFSLLKKDWITNCDSFDELLAKDTKIWIRPGGNGMEFLNLWTYELAKRYYSVMRRIIRKYDQIHLILGDRYAQYWELPVLKAARPYVDVISTNYGAEYLDGSLTQYYLSTIHEVTKKPILISEFYWNAMENRSGNKNSTKAFPIVQTQKQRAASLSRNLKSLLSLPYIVGAHWFQLYDEPEKGRPDGEDNNMGLVDIQGTPYDEVVSAIRDLDINKLHSNSTDAKSCATVPKAPEFPMAGLLSWPRQEGWIKPLTPIAFADLYLCCDSDYLYVGLHAMDFIHRDLYRDKVVPASERPCLELKIGSAKPLRLTFMADIPASVTGLDNIIVAEIPGIKHICIIAIPWQSLGGRRTGLISISGSLSQHSKAATMRWVSKVGVR